MRTVLIASRSFLPGCSTSATVSAASVSRSTRCALRGFERYQVAEKLIAPRIISRASFGSAASRPSPVQLVERRLPDRVVAVLQLDDAAPVLRRQRAPVVEHHRNEVAAGVVEDAVVRAHEAAEAVDRVEPGLVEHGAGAVEAEAEPLFHHRHQQLVLVGEVIERAARLHADGAGDVADRRALEALLAEQLRGGADQLAATVVGGAVSGVCTLTGAGHLRYKATACLASRE